MKKVATDPSDFDRAIMDAVMCGTGIVKIVYRPDGELEMTHVPIDQFYDLSEELCWRAANTHKAES